jgi:hypothetical protein
MKSIRLLYQILSAGANLAVLGYFGFLLVKTWRESKVYAEYDYYDPTAFVVMGVFLLPAAMLGLRYLVRCVRKAMWV